MNGVNQITRRFVFDAGHRVLGHGGKCRRLHGHRYEVEVTCTTPKLDQLSMVIDFGVIKTKIGSWIDGTLDHRMILHYKDPLLEAVYNQTLLSHSSGTRAKDIISSDQHHYLDDCPYVMPHELQPTAEGLAFVMFEEFSNLLANDNVEVTNVRVFETENCWAEYGLR